MSSKVSEATITSTVGTFKAQRSDRRFFLYKTDPRGFVKKHLPSPVTDRRR